MQPQLLWLGSEGGIKSYHIKDRQWRWYPEVKDVTCLLVDKRNKNIIWAGTKNGLYIFSRKKQKWLKAGQYFSKLKADQKTFAVFQEGEVSAIILDPKRPKMVFLATDRGLVHFDREEEKSRFFTVDDGLIEDNITCITSDSYQPELFWLGSDGGLMSFDVKELKVNRHFSQSDIPGDSIHTLAVNKEWVLVNNPDGGIAGYHKEGQYWDKYSPDTTGNLDDHQVLALFCSDDGKSTKLLVGTRTYGIFIFDETTKKSAHLDEIGLSITTFSWSGNMSDQVWFAGHVCSGGGVGNYSFEESSWWLTYPMVVLDETYPVTWKEVQKDQQGF